MQGDKVLSLAISSDGKSLAVGAHMDDPNDEVLPTLTLWDIEVPPIFWTGG